MTRCLEIEGRMVEQLDQPMLRWMYTMSCGWQAAIAGDTNQVENYLRKRSRSAPIVANPTPPSFSGDSPRGSPHRRRNLGDLVSIIEQTAVEAPEMASVAESRRCWRSAAQAERADPAGELLEEFANAGFALPMDAFWLTAMSAYAEAAMVKFRRTEVRRTAVRPPGSMG